MKYKITISPKAAEHLQHLAKSEPKSFAKAARFLKELAEHPKTGTGHPEPLKGQPTNRWSREITKKHRMVYRIFDTEVYVEVLAAYGHYDDK